MSSDFANPGEPVKISQRLRSQHTPEPPVTDEFTEDDAIVPAPRKLPYTFAEHAWALRYLRRQGITPTNSSILEAVELRRKELASGQNPELSSTPTPQTPPVELPQTQKDSLAEPYDRLGEAALFEREIIRQEEFLAEAREWNHYLLARVDALMEEIVNLQESSLLLTQNVEEKNPPHPSPSNLPQSVTVDAPTDSAALSSAQSSQEFALTPPPPADWEKQLRESQEQCRALEAQLEELKIEKVLNQSLESVIEEQRLSLEASSQRIEALTRQLEEAGHLKVRAEQLHAELLEAKSSLEAYRARESAWRSTQGNFETQRARADAEIMRLRNALDQQEIELTRLRGENEHLASLLEAERSRLHAEQTRSAAIIAQLTRQLEEERAARQREQSEHSSAIEQLCFQFEQERIELEAAQKRSSETIAQLQKQVEDLQALVKTARQNSDQIDRLRAADARIRELESINESTSHTLSSLRTELTSANSALLESEKRAAEAQKALDALRIESEQQIRRLQERIAELEASLKQPTPENPAHQTPSTEEIEALRRDLRIQTETAERHKAAIGLLQKKLLETEKELNELRAQKTASLSPAPTNHTAQPEEHTQVPHPCSAHLPSSTPAATHPDAERRGSRFVLLSMGLLVGIAGAALTIRYWPGLSQPQTSHSHTLEKNVSADAQSPQIASATFTRQRSEPAADEETRLSSSQNEGFSISQKTSHTSDPAPGRIVRTGTVNEHASRPSNPAALLVPEAQESGQPLRADSLSPFPPTALLPPIPARRSPSTDWNRANLPVPARIDGLFNPAGQIDFQRLRRVWQESRRGNLAPRSMDDQLPALFDSFDGVPAAARAGDPDCQYQLALRLIVDAWSGYQAGIDATDPLREAYHWMQKAAQAGNPDALYIGGQMRRLGIGGTEDAEKGLAVINFAARSGQPDAQEFLGVEFLNLYFQTGLEEYARTSANNFRAAAEQGRPLGELLYGRMLAEGIGVPQDTPAGVRWLEKAYRHGKSEALDYLRDAANAGSEEAAAALRQLAPNDNRSKPADPENATSAEARKATNSSTEETESSTGTCPPHQTQLESTQPAPTAGENNPEFMPPQNERSPQTVASETTSSFTLQQKEHGSAPEPLPDLAPGERVENLPINNDE